MTNQTDSNQNPKQTNQKSKRLISLLVVLLVSISIAGYWLLNSQSALQGTLSAINRLSSGAIQFEGIRGTLRNIQINSIHFANEEFQLTLHNTHVTWNPNDLLQKQIKIDQLSVEAMDIRILPSPTAAPQRTLPENLSLPFALSVHQIKVDSIYLISTTLESPDLIISDLTLSLDSNGHYHRLNNLDFRTPWGVFSALAELNGNSPFDLSAQIDLSDAHQWGDAQAVIAGNLEQMDIQIHAKQSLTKRELTLQLQPFAANPVTQLHAVLEKLNPASFVSDAPNASLSVTANLIRNESGQLKGKILLENHAAATLNDGGLPFSAISAQARITAEVLQLQDIHAQITPGEIVSGDLIWQLEEASGAANLLVSKVNPQHIDSRIRAAQVSGEIKLEGNAQTQSARMQLKDNSISFNAAITRNAERVALEQFQLQRNKSQLTGQGKFDLDNERSFELSGNLENFNISDFIQAPDSNLNAAIQLSGQLSPQISGILQYTIQKSRLAKFPVTGAGQIAFNGLDQFKGKAELNIGSNHFLAQGGTGESGETYQLAVNAPALKQIGFGLAGDLQTHIQWNGNLQSPDLELKIKSRQLHLPGNHHLLGLVADGRLNNETISLKATIENYAASDKATLQHVEINTSGKISDHTLLAKAQINDAFKIQLKAVGGLDRRSPAQSRRWNGQLAEFTSTGKIPVRLMTPTALAINTEFVSLGHTKLSVSDGFLNIDQLHWTPQEWKTQGHFSGIALLPGEFQNLKQSSLHLGGHWDFISNSQLTGNLHIQREKGDWYLPNEIAQPLGLEVAQLKVVAQNGKITGQFELASQSIGTAKAHLTVPTKQSNNSWTIPDEAPLNGEVIARIKDLKWMESLLGDSVSTNGQLEAQATIQGTLKQPDFNGRVSGTQLSVVLLEHGINLQQGNLDANFRQSNLKIDRLHFITPHEAQPDDRLLKDVKLDSASGALTITGNIGLVGNESQLDFKMNQLPFTHKTDYWIVASGSGQARYHKNNLSVTGSLAADAGLLLQPPQDRPALPDDIVFVNTPNTAPKNLSLLLDIVLNLGEKFYLRAAGLEGRLAGQLQVQNDKNNTLKVNGAIAAKDTTFKAYGQNLTVQRGIVSFQGPLDDPGLNILAVREGLAVEAGVEIMGSVRHPRVTLVSTPNVPDTEKLSWIVLGRKPDPSGLDTSVLLAAAGSILGGQSGSGIMEQITKALGVDEISFKQAGIGSSLSGQIGVVGKRISSRVYLSYERSLATTTMGITKLTYNLTPKITVVTQAGEDSAIDLFYTFQFD
ncbi:translocation/assembly module TamB domain-containing protein [Nitrosomonas sp.]|uniref:translocation/assembly module TamB domain-containing protein n=1 Tax=Nitrosomonas sp. TaxID=42353 RepID=UPI00271FD5E8|nr:translocation/assembly module TamB domain-containing protein [Nitrosomonas sp.]MDO8894814.1 translocation/assembly module TamB domain-containing protein [Nitrosomonas sp.]